MWSNGELFMSIYCVEKVLRIMNIENKFIKD